MNDYHAAKRIYNASKARSAHSDEKGAKKKEQRSNNATSLAPANENLEKGNLNKNLAESRSIWELLDVIRPEEKTNDFGFCRGIQVHLTENVKLCGLRKARENPIMDMIGTLCNHLSSREEEIQSWIKFSDDVATSAAEKLKQHRCDYRTILESRESAWTHLREIQRKLVKLRSEMSSLREEASRVMSTYLAMIEQARDRIKQQVSCHCDTLKSESKSEVCDAVERLSRRHEDEKQRLEATIYSQNFSFQLGESRRMLLRSQLDNAIESFEREKNDLKLQIVESNKRTEQASNDLLDARQKISHLEALLDKEKLDHEHKIADMEEATARELDDIDARVKESFKTMVDNKNKEIEAALHRAYAAEASAKHAEKVLSELKASIIPPISAAESSNES